jgi:hypothetical protein
MNRKERPSRVLERKGDLLIMDRSDPHAFDGVCELCGTTGELRPYGPNNENICFDCGMKDEATTKKKYKEFLKMRKRQQ